MVQTDAERRYSRIEERSQKYDERFRTIDEEVFALDERRRKLGEEFDRFLAGAADDLDSDEYYEIFGTCPDESGKAPASTPAPKRAPYEGAIFMSLDNLGIARDEFDPRHIEAFLRGRFVTLDHLSARSFQYAVKAAVECIRAAGVEESEKFAESHGL